jgi:phosphotransferase system enzyme I (PtsI)
VARTIGPAQAAIFAAQLLILDDPLLTRRADELVRSERINADWAVERAGAEVQELFARDGDAWLRERAGDLTDVTARLLRSLRPDRDPLVDLIRELEPPLILVADELPPSVAAQLDWSRVRGLVCDAGGPTHHTAILVRSLGVPAVVGLAGATSVIGPGQTVAIDGSAGEVAVEPSAEVLESWHARAAVQQAEERALGALARSPCRNRRRRAAAVRGQPGNRGRKCTGSRRSAPKASGSIDRSFLLDAFDPDGVSEEAQYETYRALLAAMHPLPVTIRTFDAPEERGAGRSGGRDRFGLRGIRADLQHDERLRTQLRALLRAAPAGELRILLPFVTSVDELRAARQIVVATARELGGAPMVPVGAMIEVPAAALTVDQLALEADFLSVGTNDLIQYTLAVDRTDERLAGYYAPGTPAVLRLLRGAAIAARRAKRPLSICGEMAADPVMVAVLVGLGFRSFSMATSAIPMVKQGIRSVDSRDAIQLARRALRASSADDVRELLAPVAAAMH